VHTVLRGRKIHVVEETDYPFRGTVKLTINPEEPLAFPLQLRVPVWAAATTLRVNGEPQPSPSAGSFAHLERTWRSGDRVEIVFPMNPRVSRGFNDSVSIERGPLLFSYGVGETWVKLADRGMTADWQVFPSTPWNYALNIDEQEPSRSITVTQTEVGESVFSAKHAPVRLNVEARKLSAWRAEDGVANPMPQSPVTTNEPKETITLIPYAAAKLRISAFPRLGPADHRG